MAELQFLPPATKLGQGYIFTGVCDSVHREGSAPGGCPVGGGACWGGAWSGWVPAVGFLLPGVGGAWSGGMPGPGWRPLGMATAAGSTHPTGMNSCLEDYSKRHLYANNL